MDNKNKIEMITPKEKAKELVDKYIPLSLRLYSDYEWVEEIAPNRFTWITF